MPVRDFTLREFILGDIPAIAAIRNASISISPDFYSMTVDRFRYDHYDEDTSLQSRIVVAADDDGRVLGFYHLYTDETLLARGRANLDSIHVHPDARGRGVGARLLDDAIATAAGWRGEYVSTAIPEDHPRSLAFLERHGFRPVRRFYKMRLNDPRPSGPAELPAGFTIRSFQPGEDEEAFVAVFNAAFADHWDFVPVTHAEVALWNRRPSFSPRGCFLLFDGAALVGFTTVVYDPDLAAQTGEAVARIFEMGMLPAYRRRGLGFAMLQVAFAYARERGFKAIDLVTDAENEAAKQLYAKLGFQERRATVVLHRPI